MGATNAFRTRPIASVAMVLTLSLGIGATLTLFAILHALVLREVPYPEPNRIVRIIPKRVGSPLTGLLSGFDFAEWRSNTRVLSALAGYSAERLVLGTSESATITEVVLVTPSMFRVLGTRPSLGRAFREEDAFSGANRVTIVCHKLWTERFGADPSLVGRTITLDGIPHVVVGVLPEWVRFPLPGAGVWLPLDPRSEVQSFEDGRKRVLVKHLSVVGRLLPSASIPAVRAEGEAVLREPRTRLEISSLWDDTTAGIRMALALTQVVTLLVLAIACANVANLLLAESVRSARDTALRLALGASRRSVLRGLVTTALLRTAPAGPLGYLLAWAGVEWFRRRVPGVGPPLTGAMLEPTVALVGVLLTVGSGVGASLWPAVRAIRSGLSLVASRHTSPDLVSTGRWLRASRLLVVFQIALSLTLVVATGLLVTSVRRVLESQRFLIADVLIAEVSLPGSLTHDVESRRSKWLALLQGVREIPGVQRAALASRLPLRGQGSLLLDVSDEASDSAIEFTSRHGSITSYVLVSDEYFETLGLRFTQGGSFSGADGLVVNRRLAYRDFGRTDVVGRPLEFRGRVWPILGVVGGAGEDWTKATPTIYAPIRGLGYGGTPWSRDLVRMSVFVLPERGGNISGGTISPAIRRAVPEAAVERVVPFSELLQESAGSLKLYSRLLGVAALLAAGLALFGIAAMMMSDLFSRSREIGIRFAVGAERRHVVTMALSDAGRLIGLGLLAGLVGALALSGALRATLPEVGTPGVYMIVASAALVATGGLAACSLPVWRATRVDPATILRSE